MNNHRNDFEKFHAENPHIFDLFKKFAVYVRSKGYRNYSAKVIFERIRWHVNVETSDKEFKINNNYKAYYTRLLEDVDPRFVGFFRKRQTNGERYS